MKRRILVSVRREVAPPHREEYHAAWARARELAGARGAHAWRFVAADDPGRFLEFLEFAAGDDPRGDEELARALRRLEEHGSGRAEQWEERS